jgi:hypothetical protein
VIGDMYLVTREEHDDGGIKITDMALLASDPTVEIVRIEHEGAVQYLSREEYEGRRAGTWETMRG